MKSENKQLNISKESGHVEIERDFMFPPKSGGLSITVKAKNRQEAEEKYAKIISNKNEK